MKIIKTNESINFFHTIIRANKMKGDIDNDGKITSEDVDKVYNHVNGISDLNDAQKEAADMDGNGKITLKDLNKVYYIVNDSGKAEFVSAWVTCDDGFYNDIIVEDIAADMEAFIQADIELTKAECFDGFVRVYAKQPSLVDCSCTILYFSVEE